MKNINISLKASEGRINCGYAPSFLLAVILLVGLVSPLSAATFTLNTNQTSYSTGDTLTISGKIVATNDSGVLSDIYLLLVSPNGTTQSLDGNNAWNNTLVPVLSSFSLTNLNATNFYTSPQLTANQPIGIYNIYLIAVPAGQNPITSAVKLGLTMTSITFSVKPAPIPTSPVPLNLTGKNPDLVRQGSYLVNTIGSCSGCHTNPEFASGGDPFQGQAKKIDPATYLAGGQSFGTMISRNITPDANGNPAGLTLDQFIQVMRTGKDFDVPNATLQVMPWPYFKDMTDNDLKAIYEYLRAIPSIVNSN